MSEFKSSRGYLFAVGRHPTSGDVDDRIVAWNDPETGSWETLATNEAGYIVLPVGVGPDPEIREVDGRVLIGARFELRHCGKPFVWGVFPQAEAA